MSGVKDAEASAHPSPLPDRQENGATRSDGRRWLDALLERLVTDSEFNPDWKEIFTEWLEGRPNYQSDDWLTVCFLVALNIDDAGTRGSGTQAITFPGLPGDDGRFYVPSAFATKAAAGRKRMRQERNAVHRAKADQSQGD